MNDDVCQDIFFLVSRLGKRGLAFLLYLSLSDSGREETELFFIGNLSETLIGFIRSSLYVFRKIKNLTML